MANGLNLCMFVGNVGADPELRMTPNGTAVLKFRIGCSEPKKVGDRWETHTEWPQITVWGRRAEGLSKFLEKGMAVTITSRMRSSSYEDREGIKRYRTEFIADEVIVHGKRPSRDGSRSEGSGRSSRNDPPQDDYGPGPDAGGGDFSGGGDYGHDDEDIPF